MSQKNKTADNAQDIFEKEYQETYQAWSHIKVEQLKQHDVDLRI